MRLTLTIPQIRLKEFTDLQRTRCEGSFILVQWPKHDRKWKDLLNLLSFQDGGNQFNENGISLLCLILRSKRAVPMSQQSS